LAEVTCQVGGFDGQVHGVSTRARVSPVSQKSNCGGDWGLNATVVLLGEQGGGPHQAATGREN